MSQELLNIPSDSLDVPEIKHQHSPCKERAV